MSTRPFVSIIVPAFNAEDSIAPLLAALGRQTYPSSLYEIILVDNGSTDRTSIRAMEIAASFACRFQALSETAIQGSYAARNAALSRASGDILAFTDADCLPAERWIEAGVDALLEQEADLAGGHVRFTFSSDRPSAAEVIDSRTNMQMERDIRQRGVAKTANLFVRKRVFAAIGRFPDHLKSGGDVQWTRAATTAGFRLVFAPCAEVSHPARGWSDVFQKQLRVGRGHLPAMRSAGMSWRSILMESLSIPKGARFSRDAPSANSPEPVHCPSRAALVSAMVWSRAATLTGRLSFLLTHLFRLP